MDGSGKKSISLISTDGGSVRLTIHEHQARSDSIPCVGCWIRTDTDNKGAIRLLISAILDCGNNTGIDITNLPSPLYVNVANLSLLSFRGTENGDKVDILYRC